MCCYTLPFNWIRINSLLDAIFLLHSPIQVIRVLWVGIVGVNIGLACTPYAHWTLISLFLYQYSVDMRVNDNNRRNRRRLFANILAALNCLFVISPLFISQFTQNTIHSHHTVCIMKFWRKRGRKQMNVDWNWNERTKRNENEIKNNTEVRRPTTVTSCGNGIETDTKQTPRMRVHNRKWETENWYIIMVFVRKNRWTNVWHVVGHWTHLTHAALASDCIRNHTHTHSSVQPLNLMKEKKTQFFFFWSEPDYARAFDSIPHSLRIFTFRFRCRFLSLVSFGNLLSLSVLQHFEQVCISRHACCLYFMRRALSFFIIAVDYSISLICGEGWSGVQNTWLVSIKILPFDG